MIEQENVQLSNSKELTRVQSQELATPTIKIIVFEFIALVDEVVLSLGITRISKVQSS